MQILHFTMFFLLCDYPPMSKAFLLTKNANLPLNCLVKRDVMFQLEKNVPPSEWILHLYIHIFITVVNQMNRSLSAKPLDHLKCVHICSREG